MVCRVYVKNKYADPDKNLKDAVREFRNRVGSAKIMHLLKKRDFFESKTVIRKRKKHESKRKAWEGMVEEKILNGDPLDISPGVLKRIMKRLANSKNGGDDECHKRK